MNLRQLFKPMSWRDSLIFGVVVGVVVFAVLMLSG
jgi:hypothetical protein